MAQKSDNRMVFTRCQKTQVSYSQCTGTLLQTCIKGQNLCAEAVTIASFLTPREQLQNRG